MFGNGISIFLFVDECMDDDDDGCPEKSSAHVNNKKK